MHFLARTMSNLGLKTARDAEKFFAHGENFCENMLHNLNNFVQLPTSDIGFHALQCECSIDEEIETNVFLKCELPELPRNRQLFFEWVTSGCELEMVCQP
jgi:hypothetical protein